MIHPLVDEDAWCYWVISVGALLSFVGLIAACICSCRRNENKNEFLGLAGMVTLKHSENESFNGLPALDVPQILTQDAVDCGKRATTANRSLPDIPKDRCPERGNELETESQDIYESTEPTGDQSELYATVQDKAEWNAVGDDSREDRGENSTRQTAINQNKDVHYQYARYPPNESGNEEHPYAQLKNVEKVDINQSRDRNNTGQTTDTEKPSTSANQAVVNPVAPPRTRRSSSHNSLLVMESVCGIQAANAITGGVQANQDLPYMTPPLLAPTFPYAGQPQHNASPLQHFSGDSQDSKGYTSISVREPLANIIAQTKAVSQQHQTIRPLVDSHYTTVSDDSDEMYAAIDEQDKLYTSGSDTYAQIQPAVTELQRPVVIEQHVPVHNQPSLRPEEAHYAAPQPPSVDSLRHVAHAHSRQASSSSANSSIINPGSPKPEKRQANSPLPPPPPPPPPPPTTEQSSTTYDGVAEVYALVDKKGKTEERGKCGGKSLEDMYAKVIKKKKEDHVEEKNPIISTQSHLQNSSEVQKTNILDNGRISWSSHDSSDAKRDSEIVVPNSPGIFDANLENVFDSPTAASAAGLTKREFKQDSGNFDHGYEALNNSKDSAAADPDYETLRPQHGSLAAKKLARNSGDFLVSTELITQVIYSSVALKHRQVSNASSDDPGYEKVRLTCRTLELENDTDSEPNYESMPHDVCEPNYASVCRPGDSDTDPNYESVGHGDPNYESVKYMSLARKDEPPYEQVNNRFAVTAAAATIVDDYERVSRARNAPGYEEIRKEVRVEEQKSGGETDDEQYVQV